VLSADIGKVIVLNMSEKRLYGLDDTGLVTLQSRDQRQFLLETQTAQAFTQMQQAAAADGISIAICSAYRSFSRQQQLWDAKASGQRPLLDCNFRPISNRQSMDENTLLHTLLLWSALPGTSRHHWGTDLDLFDDRAIQRQQLQLVNAEYQADGPCFYLHQWLAANAADYGFYRPFQTGMSGTSPELWHYSYYPLAEQLRCQYDVTQLADILANSNICLKGPILEQLPALVTRYVKTVAPIPTANCN
jgi:LAS superfamily LD-carboxypeptidase LdcB